MEGPSQCAYKYLQSPHSSSCDGQFDDAVSLFVHSFYSFCAAHLVFCFLPACEPPLQYINYWYLMEATAPFNIAEVSM